MTYAAEVLADSPLLYWRLDEASGTAAADASGNSRPGTYAGGFTLGGTSPITSDAGSKAVALNGSTGKITSAYNPFTGQRTFEGWFNRTNHGHTDELIETSTGGVRLDLTTGQSIEWWPNFISDISTVWASAWPGDAQWVYVVLTMDGSAHLARLYLNGVDKGQKATAPYYSSPGNILLGNGTLLGSLDEFAIYSGLLSATRVSAHYQAATAIVVVGSQASSAAAAGAGHPAVAVAGSAAVETEAAFVEFIPAPPVLASWVGIRESPAPSSPVVVGSQAVEHDTATPIRVLLGRMASEVDLGYVGANLPNADHGQDVRDWLKLDPSTLKDGVAYMPQRPDPPSPLAYYAGDTGTLAGSAYAHPLNVSLARNGYLTLAAHDGPGTVNVDLSPTAGGSSISDGSKGGGLLFGGLNRPQGIGDVRTILDGINFQNGIISLGGSRRFRMWYCNNTYPITTWLDHFNAACAASGVPVVWPIPNTTQYSNVRDDVYGFYMKGNFTPTGFRLDQGQGFFKPNQIRIYGCDFHNIGDDAVYLGGAQNGIEVRGIRTWDVNNYDWPHYNPDWFHSDGIQLIGGEYQVLVESSLFGGDVQIATQMGPIDYMTFDDIWQCQAPGTGMSLDARYSRNFGDHCHIGGDRPYRWFGNGQFSGPHNTWPETPSYGGSAWDIGVSEYAPANMTNLPRTFIHGMDGNGQLPSGVSLVADTNGLIGILGGSPNISLIVDHVDAPPNRWRVAHPHDTRDDVMAGTYD